MPGELRINELLLNITTQLAKLQATVDAKFSEHDRRLESLESKNTCQNDSSTYGYIVPLLIKTLLIALGVIATSAGAGGILKQIFGF